MSHPAIENRTPFVFEPLALADEQMRPLLVLVIKATYSIGPQGLQLAEAQAPLCLAGQHWGEPEKS
ncbi:MAG TPA: DUF2169 domain-containing protein, partial [Archangium sp.]|nr:DUF2169 domain-containing protein [Archangium sp.]